MLSYVVKQCEGASRMKEKNCRQKRAHRRGRK